MELTKADKRQLHDLVKRGVLRRCEEWLHQKCDILIALNLIIYVRSRLQNISAALFGNLGNYLYLCSIN